MPQQAKIENTCAARQQIVANKMKKSKRMPKKDKETNEESIAKKPLNRALRSMKSRRRKKQISGEKECQHFKRCILYARVSEPTKYIPHTSNQMFVKLFY